MNQQDNLDLNINDINSNNSINNFIPDGLKDKIISFDILVEMIVSNNIDKKLFDDLGEILIYYKNNLIADN